MNPVIMNGGINSRLLSIYYWLIGLGFRPEDIMLNLLTPFVPLAVSTNSYKIPLCAKYKDQGTGALTADQTQNLLGANDAFALVGLRQVVRKRISTAYAVCDICGYADLTLFNASGENDQIKGVFQGSFTELKIETKTVLENLPGRLLSYAPNSPQLAAATVPATGSANDMDRFVGASKDILINGDTDAAFNTVLKGFTLAAAIVGDSSVSGEANDLGIEVLGFTVKGAGDVAAKMAVQQGNSCYVRPSAN